MGHEVNPKALGLELPSPAAGLGAYAAWARTGNLVVTSGQLPWKDGVLAVQGRLGDGVSPDEGNHAARLCALNAIAQLSAACDGDLDRVRRIVRLEGDLLCAADFTDHARVLDGASDVFNAVFPHLEPHSRAVHGVFSMPLGVPVILYVEAEIAGPEKHDARDASGPSPEWTAELREELSANTSNGAVGQILVSETDRVRVWHISLDPGERLSFHRHVLDYFWTAVTSGSTRSRHGDGSVTEVHYQPGATKHFVFGPGESMIHDLQNTGDTVLVFTTVEFLKSANPPLALR